MQGKKKTPPTWAGRVLTFFHVVLLLCAPTMGYAGALVGPQVFERMFIFGDSLSDNGNVFALTGAVPFPTRYADGRFSNGPVWTDYLAQSWNIDLAASAAGFDLGAGDSVNFAFGGSGSQDTANLTPGGFAVPGAKYQVEIYGDALGAAGLSADPQALHVLWSGANDYLIDSDLGVTPDPSVSVANVVAAISDLYDLGARQVLVLNLPPLGDTPLAALTGDEARLSAVTLAYNQKLAADVARLRQQLADVSLTLFDVHQLFTEVMSDPTGFGFSSDLSAGPATPCLLDPSPQHCSPIAFETDQLFWDEQHPTTAFHRLLAQRVPLPGTALLLLPGLFILAERRLRRPERTYGAAGAGCRCDAGPPPSEHPPIVIARERSRILVSAGA